MSIIGLSGSLNAYLEFSEIDTHDKVMVKFDSIDAVIESTSTDSDGNQIKYASIFFNGQRINVEETYEEVVSRIKQTIRGY